MKKSAILPAILICFCLVGKKEINAVQNAGLVSVHIDDDYQILEKKAEEQKENAKEIKNVIDRIQKSYTKDAEGEPVSINIYFFEDGMEEVIGENSISFKEIQKDLQKIQTLLWFGENSNSGWLISLSGSREGVRDVYEDIIYQLKDEQMEEDKDYFVISNDEQKDREIQNVYSGVANVVPVEIAQYSNFNSGNLDFLMVNLEYKNILERISYGLETDEKTENNSLYLYKYKEQEGVGRDKRNEWQLSFSIEVPKQARFYWDIKSYLWENGRIKEWVNDEIQCYTKHDSLDDEKMKETFQISGKEVPDGKLLICVTGQLKNYWDKEYLWVNEVEGEAGEFLKHFYNEAEERWQESEPYVYFEEMFLLDGLPESSVENEKRGNKKWKRDLNMIIERRKKVHYKEKFSIVSWPW